MQDPYQGVGYEAAGLGPVRGARSVSMPVQVPVARVILHSEHLVLTAGNMGSGEASCESVYGTM